MMDFILPVKDLLKVVCLRIGDILLCSLIVCRSDEMADVAEVIAADTVFNLYAAGRNLSFFILEVLEIQRVGVSARIYIYHAAGLSAGIQVIYAHGKFRAVRKVVGDRILAAYIVADFHRTGLYLKAKLFELLVKDVIEKDSLGDLAKFRVAVLIVSHVNACVLDFLRVKVMEDTFCDDDGTVVDSKNLAFYD